MDFVIPLPPALNTLYRTSSRRPGVYKTQEAKDYEEEVALRLRLLKPTDQPVSLTVDCYFGRSNNDIDSRLKVLLDVLQGIVYINDRQIVELIVRKHVDKLSPRVSVHATVVPEGTL